LTVHAFKTTRIWKKPTTICSTIWKLKYITVFVLTSRPARNPLKVHCKVFFSNWFDFYYWYNCRRHSKNIQRESFFVRLQSLTLQHRCDLYSDSVYTENYKGCNISPFYEKSPVQSVYLRHRAKLNVYSLVCSNLSQPISTRRKHYFKHVRALSLTKKKKCRQNGVQNACLFLNNRFVHFACEIDTNFNYVSWY
jgi:hypothetical protein